MYEISSHNGNHARIEYNNQYPEEFIFFLENTQNSATRWFRLDINMLTGARY
jgi:hypothetical protein